VSSRRRLNMSSVEELEAAVKSLPETDYAKFRDWFAKFEASNWDMQIEDDISAGKLDTLAERAIAANRASATTSL
jgi:hypothetical protein